MGKVDDNENSVFKYDRFKHLKRHQKPVVFKYIVIYFSHLFLYITFSLRVLNNLLIYIHT